ncbi:hypothetical protein Tco_0065860 [Tanacetum coccineum]
MTMPRMQLNSKFVNNMLPEWSRFITEVKLNRGLKESNFDQLYAYLKQHEVHANENRMMMERKTFPKERMQEEMLRTGNVGKVINSVANRIPGQAKPIMRTVLQFLIDDVDDLYSILDHSFEDKVEDRLFKQDQSVQMVHMLCRPKPFYDEKNKVAIGYKNPLCLTRAKQVQSALYDGNEIVRTNHAPAVVHDSDDTLEIAEITRKRMLEKVKSHFCVEHKVKFAPPDYSKENYLAIFTPQRDLTPKQIFWSKDENYQEKGKTSDLNHCQSTD